MLELIKIQTLLLINNIKKREEFRRNKRLAVGKTKYFCIGRNKTGTTSLKKAFLDLGFPVGDQKAAELIASKYYFERKFRPIIAYCESAQVFQDAPFSWPETFMCLDRAYPGSKFILTVRDDADQWYKSITQYHSKMFGNGNLPTASDLRSAKYVCKGFIYKSVKRHGVPDDDMYNKKIMINDYNNHNKTIMDYFKNRPEDLLVINLSEKDSYRKFINFIDVDSPFSNFPWENKTK